jgi:HEAT repeat protein
MPLNVASTQHHGSDAVDSLPKANLAWPAQRQTAPNRHRTAAKRGNGVDAVINLLESEDPADRAEGVSRARASSNPEVAARLAGLARNDVVADAQRQAAAEALGAMSITVAHEALYTMLAEVDPRLRGFAALGLGQVRTQRSVDALLAALTDKVNTVRNLAERSLLALPDAVRDYGVQPLLALLRHPVPLTRSPAARLIGLTEDPRALPPLLDLLSGDSQWLVRMWAAKALGDLGLPDAVAPLTRALQCDEKDRVRAAAAEAIGKLRPPDAEVLLRLAYETDPDGGVRKIAAEALQALGLAGFGEESDPFADDD